MTDRIIPASELIINDDGSIFHLHITPEDLADFVILVGDPGRVPTVASFFDEDSVEVDKASREFHTITGRYNGRRVSVISTGIGTDNIDIVMSELDALANVDFATRTLKKEHRRLTILRIGTCGGVQSDTPVGSYIFSEYSIGFDGLLNWYKGGETVRIQEMEEAFVKHMDWPDRLPRPYFIKSSDKLKNLLAARVICGMTVSAPGFYGPQGRWVRLHPIFDNLVNSLESFDYNGVRVTNIEMESSAISALSAMLGHDAGTVCLVVASRYAGKSNPNYRPLMMKMIETVLDTITAPE